ncbi:MAG: hypothetical protein L3K14_04400 [Thermoplasmata archaeon]|nr:hypothetical protein [Thermoplasmata archaeon]
MLAVVTLFLTVLALPTLAMGGAPGRDSAIMARHAPPQSDVASAPSRSASEVSPLASWAWGVETNLSVTLDFLGAYNSSQNLTAGNLTTSGAYVALHESLHLGYAAFAIVNVTSPSVGHLQVQLQAAEYQVLEIELAAQGTFPAAGNYTDNSSVPLVPMNVGLHARVGTLALYQASLNLTTGTNGSLSLDNERVAMYRAINISLVASNFPNVTRSPGSWSVHYVTGWIQADGWEAAALSANFTPAIPLVEGPLHVGKNWAASSTVRFVGSWAAASAISAGVPNGPSGSQSRAASAALNWTETLTFDFVVVGTKTIYEPNGTAETGYVIAYTDSGGSKSVILVDGLLLLPAADPSHAAGVAPAVQEHPAAAAVAQTATPGDRAVITPNRPVPASVEAKPASGTDVVATPITPAQAAQGIHSLKSPAHPLSGVGGGSAGAPLVPLLLIGLIAVAGSVVLYRTTRRR